MKNSIFLSIIYAIFFIIIIGQNGCKKDSPTEPEIEEPVIEMTQNIGESGGIIEVSGITINFEPETIDSITKITVIKDNTVSVVPPADKVTYDQKNVYKITANIDSLKKPVLITIKYSPELITSGYSAQDLIVVHFTNDGWEFIQGVVDAVNKKITFEAQSFSSFSAGLPKHKVEFPVSFTPLNATLTFDNVYTVPSIQIQSYDYSDGFNAFYHHDEYYWGIMKAPSSLDPQNKYDKVVYAARYVNGQVNSSMDFKKKVEACVVFRLDLRQVTAASMEFDYNSKSGNAYGTNGRFYVEISNDKIVWPLTNSPVSWVKLSEEDNFCDRFWGDGTWHHIKFNFPDYLATLLSGGKTCGSTNSDGVLVRIRFSTTGDGIYPAFYGPFIDNIKFTSSGSANRVPDKASVVSPINNATNQSTAIKLQWNGSDPDGDELTYDVYLSKYNPPTTLVSSNQKNHNFIKNDLVKNTKYYWRIDSRDKYCNTTKGDVWEFTTGNDVVQNQPPSAPSSPSPADNATNQPKDVTLSWSCSDPDNDPLTYDVYFGTSSNSTTKVSSDQTGKTLLRSGLNANTTYYWKVVAKDNKGNSTSGAVWRFTTTAGTQNQPPNAPSSPSPADNATNQPKDITLSWSCSDPDNDPLIYDVYFGISSNPTSKLYSDQTGKSFLRSGLDNDRTYYWKVVAKDNHSHATESAIWQFTTEKDSTIMGIPCPGIPSITYKGKTYNTVQIDDQCWLKENLDVGTRINGNINQKNNNTTEKYCYDDKPENCDTYGGLYQWDEVMGYSSYKGTQGICPDGWHIPTWEEFKKLITLVHDSSSALKSIGQGTGEGIGKNTTGFSGLLCGVHTTIFCNFNFYGFFWSSDNINTWEAYSMNLVAPTKRIDKGSGNKTEAYSVRCLKD